MCLITVSSIRSIKNALLNTKGLIESIYSKNSDGLGVMWADNNKLHVHKTIPKSVKEARAFIEELPDLDAMIACHWRMQTHGLIDLANCHPYKIHDGTYLAHNGILQTGNARDMTKSDTWHFIDRYLQHIPVDVLHNERFAELLGMTIDGNCFVIMSADGRMTIVNKDRGMEVGDIWFSNTYAWDVSLLCPDWHKKYNRWQFDDFCDYDYRRGYAPTPKGKNKSKNDLEEYIFDTLMEWDVDYLVALLEEQPGKVIGIVLDNFNITASVPVHELSFSYSICVDAWVKQDYDELCIMGEANPQLVAESLIYYCSISTK